MSELHLTVFTYGPCGKRAEIELRPVIPENILGNMSALHSWSQLLFISMAGDLKHTDFWGCSQCGKPARETNYNTASWIHLTPPRITAYVHHVCDAGYGPCHKAVVAQNKLMGIIAGADVPAPAKLPKTEIDYPLASSCLGCKRDATGVKRFPMSRCSGCKLVRYCSTACQKNDWRRHKLICKTIRNVNRVDGEQK